VVRDASVETPFSVERIPLVPTNLLAPAMARYVSGKKPRVLALSSRGHIGYYIEQVSVDEGARRALESCASRAGTPCRVIGVDDVFTVPLPSSMKITGFFHPAANQQIAADQREATARRLSGASTGWSAVAVGGGGQAGVATQAAGEQAAVDDAIAECARRDHGCRVIAIGPWAVTPK